MVVPSYPFPPSPVFFVLSDIGPIFGSRQPSSADLVTIDLYLFGYTFKSVNPHPRDGARPRVDVRDSRISPLSQEVPVRPPGLFDPSLGYLFLLFRFRLPLFFRHPC